MSYEAIGVSTRSQIPLSHEGEVGFYVPYGESGYDITLSDLDLDTILQKGFQNILNYRTLQDFDHVVQLGELPLFMGAVSIQSEAELHELEMGVATVTQSSMYKHRGLLIANRQNWDGVWSFVSYEQQPEQKKLDIVGA